MHMTFKWHKFKCKPVNDDGQKFHSTLEWKYFNHLKLLQKNGDVVFFLRQVPFHMPGGNKYYSDFQVFYSNGEIEFVDVKGIITQEFKIKKNVVEAVYPVEIKIVKRGEF